VKLSIQNLKLYFSNNNKYKAQLQISQKRWQKGSDTCVAKKVRYFLKTSYQIFLLKYFFSSISLKIHFQYFSGMLVTENVSSVE
jgi:hypothetical protein